MIDSDDIDARLAARLRLEREARGWTLAELAARSGVSRAMASKIERGEASPTAALLGKLATAFGLTLAQVFARTEAAGQIARAADQPAWRDPETGFLRRALSPPGAGPLDLTWGELPPGAAVGYPAAAFALIADQQVFVLDGALTLVLGDATHTLGRGDCLRFGPPLPSEFRNDSTLPCRYLVATVRADG